MFLFLEPPTVETDTYYLIATPFCSREQIQQGFWTTDDSKNSTNTTLRYRSSGYEETCYKNGEGYYESNWNVKEPCQLVQWDPELFCEILENKTVGLIGDSITWQVFQSMVRTFESISSY